MPQQFVLTCFLRNKLIILLYRKYDLVSIKMFSGFKLLPKVVDSKDRPFVEQSSKAKDLDKTFGFFSVTFAP